MRHLKVGISEQTPEMRLGGGRRETEAGAGPHSMASVAVTAVKGWGAIFTVKLERQRQKSDLGTH